MKYGIGEERTMMERIESGKGSVLDKIQAGLGLYAHGPEGKPSSEKTKALMKYHGVQSLQPTDEPNVSTFERGGKKIKVRVE